MGSLLFSYTRTNARSICTLLSHSRPLVFLHPSVRSPVDTGAPRVRCSSTRERNKFPGSYRNSGTKWKDFPSREKPPSSVFEAGTAKRTAELLKRKEGKHLAEGPEEPRRPKENDIPSRPLTAAEWKNRKESAGAPQRFEVKMMEKMLAAGSAIDVAQSLLGYVATETGTVSYELLLRYLTLCVHGNHQAEVFDLYDIMRHRFKTLDTGAYSLFIKGFSRTERWRECLLLLESTKKVVTPSPRNYGDAIWGAVQHGESTTAWELYEEMVGTGLSPNQETWQTLFDSGFSGQGNESKLQSILLHMRDNQIYPGEALAKSIRAWFESLPGNMWEGSWATVETSVCRSCRARLESIQLSEEEYRQLKDRVMSDVIRGRDVFTKTTPQELESFMSFVKKRPPFDVVIDGLNVANTSSKGNQAKTLLAVVSELASQGLRVLVLGRKHMLKNSRSWDRSHMVLIQQKADCFFTENISEDDPFLLYAALHSGNHCRFVSRDLMRDHKACLPDSSARRLFFKWQRGHQLVLNNFLPGQRIRFQEIPSYDTIVQTHESSWHIPYDVEGLERCSYEVPKQWLCLRRKS
ncbi:mitochondrial ribonuclease P catalytic subunit isoform X2 [Lepisosteus oculatus]|uniref:mitochondrial ribonuclease P catalytic subunit isoform X2 n=1 Tax=Lepisosteus oculatus TaxID=7918 RepID=UPI00371B9905